MTIPARARSDESMHSKFHHFFHVQSLHSLISSLHLGWFLFASIRLHRKDRVMCTTRRWLVLAAAVLGLGVLGPEARAACCYFSAKNADILQPAQKVFINWDP